MRGQEEIDKKQYQTLFLKERLFPCVLGAVIGDSLGVPVEFKSREYLKEKPVIDMIGNGTYKLPKGTWSDDSSLTFTLMESLIKGYDINSIANNMVCFLDNGYWTPFGEVFDIGNATREALLRYKRKRSAFGCGGAEIFDNGNGAIMRIMPLVFYYGKDFSFKTKNRITEEVTSITHAHPRSILGSHIYIELLQNLFANMDKDLAYKEMKKYILENYNDYPFGNELTFYTRILDEDLSDLNEEEIKSSGYVVDTLESAIWSFLTTDSYKEAVLKAVNLGGDTDTISFIAGSLAGIYYKLEQIPMEWIEQIIKKEEILNLCQRFLDSLVKE
ncbi:ADP-ribosylglycohydrolase family protein [Listeria seeligeri]|uniref:ADP-ribosylglycohydrolase family protein n=1 Tax=Listeria seeligeri TaxID=1640 RepID=UPI0016235B5F|nr:ADP-ribosylglycohydrolase family protein [Listeria seeligeri]MBC1425607.1 ADP-ribosylglycohydrolase family protein [Listeria seeligeri]MBC1722145.1 ADP-ribosylglycohydrolase family protein [Listeria seeligeri]MBC1737749.1 ADP-ribosylglycohydrolase family protein [Listeria seeligeri]MBC1777173.1 ADP-ribosylglycohydrolase family protein [Listeria seeligeri]MBC1827465.1 ADP-ribosylglycohydrolase family protein [Listeria seeligeri]